MTTWAENSWYVIGWDYEVGNAPLARTICGVPMVFYRKLTAYQIDEGGVRARQIIKRAIAANAAAKESA
ncbi:MAG: hypothetical protein ABJ242_06645 [Marinomonas sp.]